MTRVQALPQPIVRLRQGTYQGTVLTAGLPHAVEAFLGIPYAQSTAGANRFRLAVPLPAEAAASASGTPRVVRDASRFGQYCPSTPRSSSSSSSRALAMSSGEDCLNANVYRPARGNSGPTAGPAGPLLPVVVYVHGGGFNYGNGAERNMASFVAHAIDVGGCDGSGSGGQNEVIGVSFNYRVGALGFLGWLDDTGQEDASAPLNLGLRDQQALFAWVQANIGAFGGDAGNVTIMGLSAGAHSIGHHLLYYRTGESPFHKAILESGAPTARAVFAADHPRPQAQLRQFLVACGLFGGDRQATTLTKAASSSRAHLLEALRALPLETIMRASGEQWVASQASVCWPFQPVVDGRLIRQTPIAVWRQLKQQQQQQQSHRYRPSSLSYAGVPVLTGFDSNEGANFVPADPAHAATDAHFRAFFTRLIPAFTSADLDRLAALYPDPVTHPDSPYAMPTGATPNDPAIPGLAGCHQWRRLEAAYAHYAYICPVLQTAYYIASLGSNDRTKEDSNTNARAYVYNFAALATVRRTANHAANAPIVAHEPAVLQGHPGLTAVSDAMHSAWVRFAASKNSDPNGDDISSQQQESQLWRPITPSAFCSSSAAATATATANAIMVFGQDNDELVPPAQRSAGANLGTPAQLRALTTSEIEQCKFWWNHVDLSEGYGRRNPPTKGYPAKCSRL